MTRTLKKGEFCEINVEKNKVELVVPGSSFKLSTGIS